MSSEALKRIQAEAALAANREMTVSALERIAALDAALAVAREREQRAAALIEAQQRVIDCYEDILERRPVRDFDEALSAWRLARAALVDEPAAAGEVRGRPVNEPARQPARGSDTPTGAAPDVVGAVCDAFIEWLDSVGYNSIEAAEIVASCHAAATLAGPEAGADKGASASAVSGSVRTPSGSASAAADETDNPLDPGYGNGLTI